MIWENGIETCKISYKKQIASPGSMKDTGCLGLVHWDDPEGCFGEDIAKSFAKNKFTFLRNCQLFPEGFNHFHSH